MRSPSRPPACSGRIVAVIPHRTALVVASTPHCMHRDTQSHPAIDPCSRMVWRHNLSRILPKRLLGNSRARCRRFDLSLLLYHSLHTTHLNPLYPSISRQPHAMPRSVSGTILRRPDRVCRIRKLTTSSQSRSSARPSSSAGQSRGAHTAAYPQQHQPHTQAYPAQAGAAQGKPPGLLAQAASTMGGAVAGSVVGHGISNMLFGGRTHAGEQPPPPAEYANQAREATGNCDIPAKGELCSSPITWVAMADFACRLHKVSGSYERRHDLVLVLPRGFE